MLIDVYSEPTARLVLWELLNNREPVQNISHRKMPTWNEHVAFVESKPYKCWYLIIHDNKWSGACYLSKQDEIGIFLFKNKRSLGIGEAALAELMKLHPSHRYLANIAPYNINSINFFEKQGFKLIQRTYELLK